ncbi:MAG: peptidoglycan DD-metalloendopeptidase family protein [Ignavibacteriales bacterium]|jgi:septal ring factor EnvC (AmiA/AmiB activator)|nr:MAG: peptidoglycan DD-metalloendopeptidase family protein [Ignavibacterium sp.]MDX9712750.1 peptidoglycan DD-metalloendopeptidase family protein [Ignavibacteriaceae bacterium]MEB2354098.1 peptidoglycan DD-metalloendopeptidase family protein [Ignavibacteriales bacterium]
MVKFLLKSFLIFFILFIDLSFSQSNDIEKSKQELSKIKEEITRLEKELAQKTKKEKKSLSALDNISKQNFLVNKMLVDLRTEEKQKQDQINIQIKTIEEIEREIKTLQSNYAKYVTSTYKNGSYSDWESLLNAASFQQAVIRIEYLKRFAASRKNDLIKFEKNKSDLIAAKQKLQIELEAQHKITLQKESEEKTLKQKITEERKILNEIKKDKKLLANSVNEKRKSEKKIRDLIVKLVEEAERKRKAEEELKRKEMLASTETKTKKEIIQTEYDVNLSTTSLGSFAEMKGKLNWPISKGKVVRGFGESLNPKLKTLTVNYGIDIRASGDLSVKSVGEGVVSAVEWLPGYGTVLILSHKGNFRTVYGHLSEVFVKEGDKINTGGLIGKVSEGVDGNILHFELWNGRQNVDPLTWLKK